MKALIHLDTYDMRRWDSFQDILCCECSHHSKDGECRNPVPVLMAAHEDQQDIVIPILTFSPNGEMSAYRCPGMYPGEAYLRATGQSMELPLRPTTADALLSHGPELVEVLAAMAPGNAQALREVA